MSSQRTLVLSQTILQKSILLKQGIQELKEELKNTLTQEDLDNAVNVQSSYFREEY
jgi:protein-arginine kinase activator protein McsA